MMPPFLLVLPSSHEGNAQSVYDHRFPLYVSLGFAFDSCSHLRVEHLLQFLLLDRVVSRVVLAQEFGVPRESRLVGGRGVAAAGEVAQRRSILKVLLELWHLS